MSDFNQIITWFEIPTLDFERAVNFYQTLTGKQLHREEFGEIKTAFFDHSDTIVGGSIVSGTGHTPSENGVLIYLYAGEDLQPVLDKAVELGGSVIMEKKLISPQIGYMAKFRDTEGNILALHSRS